MSPVHQAVFLDMVLAVGGMYLPRAREGGEKLLIVKDQWEVTPSQ